MVMTIDTVFLDAGGVLVFPNWQRITTALAKNGVDVDPAVMAAAEPLARRRLDSASVIAASTDQGRSWPYFNLVLECAHVPQSAATEAALVELHAYHAQHNLWETMPADVPGALKRLRGLGLRLVVVSNSNGTLPACLDRLGVTSSFDAVFDSHLEQVEKPDPRYFQRVLDRVDARANETIHVGDLYHVDVAGARNAGIRAVLLDPHNLYKEADCLRVRSLGDLASRLESSRDALQFDHPNHT
jgi:putative hydrolase of the HAD superfamily